MAFRLKAKESVQEGVRRIAREQMNRAIADVDNTRLTRDETIHRVRKRCKKIRALLRLVQPVFGSHYRLENVFFRDTADELAAFRDAQVLLKTYDAVISSPASGTNQRRLAPFRRKLIQHIEEASHNSDQEERLSRVRERLCEGRKRIAKWRLQAAGFDAIEGGLLKTYSRGRKAMEHAYRRPEPKAFHEWRKRVNYHRYHLRLLRNLWRPILKKLHREVEELSHLLGDDHDLAVLRDVLSDMSGGAGIEKDLQDLFDLIDQKSTRLRARARPLGERVYAEKSRELRKRFDTYWTVLQHDED